MCDPYVTSTHFKIRSIDRNNFWDTTPSKFSINLSKPLKGTKAQITFCQIPNTYKNITDQNNAIEANGTTYLIPTGAYTLPDLMTAIQTVLAPLGTPSVTFSPITSKMTISNGVNFTLNFNIDNSISKAIGFSPNLSYSGQNSYTGLLVPKLYDSAIYIVTNFAISIQSTSNIKNVSFVIPHNTNRSEIIQFYSASQYTFQPRVENQTLGYLEFEVRDENGRILENLGEWTIMFQIV